jgi:hypothetical protein
MLKQIVMTAVLLVLAASLPARALQITLDQVDGSVTGTPGATVGWGYSVVNDSPTDWVVLTGSIFETLSTWGTYTDFVQEPASFAVLAPGGGSFSQPFNSANSTGIGSFTIDPLALPGFTASGKIRVSYDRYTGDPMTSAAYLGMLQELVAAEVKVAAEAPVPEPGTMLLLGSGLLGILPFRRWMLRKLS